MYETSFKSGKHIIEGIVFCFSVSRLTFKVAHVFHNTLVSAVRIRTSFTDGWAVGWACRQIAVL